MPSDSSIRGVQPNNDLARSMSSTHQLGIHAPLRIRHRLPAHGSVTMLFNEIEHLLDRISFLRAYVENRKRLDRLDHAFRNPADVVEMNVISNVGWIAKHFDRLPSKDVVHSDAKSSSASFRRPTNRRTRSRSGGWSRTARRDPTQDANIAPPSVSESRTRM